MGNISISFIVIGRNEGWKLELALKSVFDAIIINDISEVSEVIYVDSNSTDNSIEIASKFPLTNIINVTDVHRNAAISRNIGASYSRGDTLIFLDGDTQLVSEFISKIIDDNYSLKYNFVSGNILEYYYDDKWKFIKQAYRTRNGNVYLDDRHEVTIGGVFFCINKSLWVKLQGMDDRLSRLEDTDFSLRLSNEGIQLLRKKELAAIHHTISYAHHDKLKKDLFSFNSKYYGLLYHRNLFNIKLIKVIVRSEFTLLSLLFISLIAVYSSSLLLLLFYPLLVLFRVWYRSRINLFSFWDVIFIPIRDITVFFSFLFFFPKKQCLNHQHSVYKPGRE
jgi:glycosyltransferase involved in cell wall biosynthesis